MNKEDVIYEYVDRLEECVRDMLSTQKTQYLYFNKSAGIYNKWSNGKLRQKDIIVKIEVEEYKECKEHNNCFISDDDHFEQYKIVDDYITQDQEFSHCGLDFVLDAYKIE